MKKMKPISFRTDMVQAILDNRKWQTCRPIKGLPEQSSFIGMMIESDKLHAAFRGRHEMADGFLIPCKYQVGDILYVKESWRIDSINTHDGFMIVEYRDGTKSLITDVDKARLERYFNQTAKQVTTGKKQTHWRGPRFMPKEMARIFLEVKDIRVVRLQKITVADVIAEGVYFERVEDGHTNDFTLTEMAFENYCRATSAYFDLWDDIYVDQPELQSHNDPYVTVTEFERVKR